MDDEVDMVCDHLGVGIHIAKSLKFMSELKAANELVIPSEVVREAGMTADMIPPPRKEGENYDKIATQFDHTRKEGLGVSLRPLKETLSDLVAFLQQRGEV